MVLARITQRLELHNALHPMPTPFRPQLSTQDSLARLHNDITKFKPSVQPPAIVTSDIKKSLNLSHMKEPFDEQEVKAYVGEY